jgi:hypothetical protein
LISLRPSGRLPVIPSLSTAISAAMRGARVRLPGRVDGGLDADVHGPDGGVEDQLVEGGHADDQAAPAFA